MAKSEAPNSGCFSGIIRRMLCTGNVPTHPSDHIPDSKSTVLEKNKPKKDEKKPEEMRAQSGGPGIVAKLMGLDSLPQDQNWVPKGTTPDSFSRSRSVNFADYLLKFDLTDQSLQHRRARTSVSFREVPESFQQQKSDFLVVYFDNEDDSSKEMRKPELGFGEPKQGKRKEKSKSKRENQSVSLKNQKEAKTTDNKISKLKNEPRKRIVPQVSKTCKRNGTRVLGSVLPYKKKGQNNDGVKLKVLKQENRKTAPEKLTRKRNNQQASKKIQPIDNNLENLSLVSVLDEVDNPYSEGLSRSMNSDLSSKAEANVSYGNELKLSTVLKKGHGKSENTDLAEYFTDLAERLRRLAEEDLSQTHWTSARAKNVLDFEDLEDICMEFEWHIIDVLLDEVTRGIAEII